MRRKQENKVGIRYSRDGKISSAFDSSVVMGIILRYSYISPPYRKVPALPSPRRGLRVRNPPCGVVSSGTLLIPDSQVRSVTQVVTGVGMINAANAYLLLAVVWPHNRTIPNEPVLLIEEVRSENPLE